MSGIERFLYTSWPNTCRTWTIVTALVKHGTASGVSRHYEALHGRDREAAVRCTGVRVGGRRLAHLSPERLDEALSRLRPSGRHGWPRDNGTPELLARVLDAVRGDDGRPNLGNASFRDMRRTGATRLNEASFGAVHRLWQSFFSKRVDFGVSNFAPAGNRHGFYFARAPGFECARSYRHVFGVVRFDLTGIPVVPAPNVYLGATAAGFGRRLRGRYAFLVAFS